MTYTSLSFAIFIVALFIIYFILPKKIRWVSLLLGSYVFYYMASGAETLGLIVLTTVVSYTIAIIIGKIHEKYKEDRQKSLIYRRLVMTTGLLYVFGVLAYLKYSNFVIEIINGFADDKIPYLNLILPLGISFYSFQIAGYLIDVYRGNSKPDRNLPKYALFTSFFPQIVQGPISRHNQLAHQLYEGHGFDYTRIKYGIMLIIWGYFKKMVIADRAAVIVMTMINNPGDFHGFEVAFGSFSYMIQIYGDFSGGIDISIGIAQIFGITMVQNFRQPYFSTSLNDYWRRWHITLGAWTRDYIFFSISLSKAASRFTKATRDKIGRYLAKMLPSCFAMGIVFMVIGIWHGAAWQYVAFAVYNAVIVMTEVLVVPAAKDFNKKHKLIKTETFAWKMVTIIITLFIIFIGKFFTMADNLTDGMLLLQNMFGTWNPSVIWDGDIVRMGLDKCNLQLLAISILVLFIADLLKEKNIEIRQTLDRQNVIIKGAVLLIAIFSIIIFGMYGSEINVTTFIYQQF